MPLADLTQPAKLDLTIVSGDSFSREIIIEESDGTPIDLAAYTGYAEIRTRPGGDLLATFTVVIDAPLGKVTISLTTTQTAALPGKGVWDLELNGGATNTHTIVTGVVCVLPDVTEGP